MKMGGFGGIGDSVFGKHNLMNILSRPVLRAFQDNVHENHSDMLFPKKHKRKYHHVAGHCRLFCKGHFPIFSLALPGMPATPW
jgi:hypothetical protein